MRGSTFPADMMSYLHTKFHDNWISSFRGVVMTRFWDGRTDRQTDERTDGRSDCTPRPAFAFGHLRSPEYQRLHTDFLFEGVISANQQANHKMNKYQH